jgi:hypothetical protein
MGRKRGSLNLKYVVRCVRCRSGKCPGKSISTGRPNSSSRVYPNKSEQYLRLRVDEDNLASFIDDHHCIWGRLEEILKRL